MESPDFTPYSGILPLIKEVPIWLKDEDADRVASYQKYDEIYWSDKRAFKLVQRGSESYPIYIPNARTIVDTTAHFLLKGATVVVDSEDEKLNKFWTDFLKREKFYSRLITNKWAGTARGDWLFHITADEDKPEGSRISLTTLDPASYFPQYDEDDSDKINEVWLAEQVLWNGEWRVKVKRYWYLNSSANPNTNAAFDGSVMVEENIYEIEGWGTADQKKLEQTLPPMMLPGEITKIPVYHFKNIDWQGWDFGASEIKGYERLMAAVNQAITDEEVALALQGLGVYATDAGPPTDEAGVEIDWEIAPAKVMEVPAGAYFRRVEGLTTVEPSLEHVKYLEDKLFESSHTFRGGSVDVQVAQSGIALAIKFLPQLAKLEQRDIAGTDLCANMLYDLKKWFMEYETFSTKWADAEVGVELGDKLPQDRTAKLNELNNMLDRKVISRKYYRKKMRELGYDDYDEEAMVKEIEEEKEADIEMQRATALATGKFQELSSGGKPENKSNNKNKPNESSGAEA